MSVLKSKYFLVFVFLFIVKIFESLYFISFTSPDFLSTHQAYVLPSVNGWGDEGYISAPENWIQTGNWVHEYSGLKAPRVPGVSVLYLFFRIFFSQVWSVNCMVLSMIGFYSFALAYFMKAFKINGLLLLLCSLFFIGDSYLSVWFTVPILSEGYCISFFLLNIAFLKKWLISSNYRHLILSGMFLGLACLTRVTFFPILFIELAILLIFLRFKIRYAVLFLIPFFILETTWIIRNYVVTDTFIPLQQIGTSQWVEHADGEVIDFTKKSEDIDVKALKSYQNGLFLKEKRFIQSFGGNWVAWNPQGSKAWLASELNEGFCFDCAYPRVIFNVDARFTQSSLLEAKNLRDKVFNEDLGVSERLLLAKKYDDFLSVATGALEEDFFISKVYSYWFLTKQWFLTSATYQVPYGFNDVGLFGKVIKLKAMTFYYLTLFFGFTFLIVRFALWRRFKEHFMIYIVLLGFIAVNWGVYIVLARTCELRYNLFIYQALTLIVILFSSELRSKLKAR